MSDYDWAISLKIYFLLIQCQSGDAQHGENSFKELKIKIHFSISLIPKWQFKR